MFSVNIQQHKGNKLKPNKVTVYSCSGCSNVAQLANSVAVKLDRAKIAQMSCVVGLGGDVSSLVKFAKKSEKILVLDGCPLQCAKKCFDRHNIAPTVHLVLTEDGLIKNIAEDVPPEVVEEYFNKIKLIIEDIEQDG